MRATINRAAPVAPPIESITLTLTPGELLSLHAALGISSLRGREKELARNSTYTNAAKTGGLPDPIYPSLYIEISNVLCDAGLVTRKFTLND